jgi:hypothetical protein
MNNRFHTVPINLSKRKIVLVDCLALPQKSGRQSVMKKFLVAMIIACLSLALCSSAMAQGPHRGGPGPAHHGGGPGFHGGPGPVHHGGPGYYRPAPPPRPGYYRPAPPPPPPRYYPNYYYRSYYYPNYYYPGYYYPGTGVYYSSPGFGISIAL